MSSAIGGMVGLDSSAAGKAGFSTSSIVLDECQKACVGAQVGGRRAGSHVDS